MAGAEESVRVILNQVWDEYKGRISIDGGSKVLVSDVNIAKTIYDGTEPVRTPFGPKISVAKRGIPGEDESKIEGIATFKATDNLEFDHYSHAFFGIASEDPKFIMEGLKAMLTAMMPKGVAVVISIKSTSGEQGEDGQLTVSLEDKMKYQSKGKIEKLTDVLEYAGFEKGKIRSLERSAEVNGNKVEAEVVLAMKWDQLSA